MFMFYKSLNCSKIISDENKYDTYDYIFESEFQ